MSDTAPIVFEIELVPLDLLRGYAFVAFGQSRRSRLFPLTLGGMAMTVLAGLVRIARGKAVPLPALVFLGVLACVLVFGPLALYALAARAHRALPSPHARYTLDAEGLVVESGRHRERLPWDRLVRVETTPHAVYLYSSATAFRIVPRRGLPEGAVETLRARFEAARSGT
ncbi:MAG: YcxB family protein [Polyangiales bacterium]